MALVYQIRVHFLHISMQLNVHVVWSNLVGIN